jgi:hypothetical protein
MGKTRETGKLVSDNIVSVNINTDRVGIGTTLPTSKLHIIGDVLVTGVTTSFDFNSTSDIRLKTNIKKIESPIEKILQISGVTFNWKKDNRLSVGVIAQEIESVFPELVQGEDTKTVNYNGLIALLIECIKDQQIEINILKDKLK